MHRAGEVGFDDVSIELAGAKAFIGRFGVSGSNNDADVKPLLNPHEPAFEAGWRIAFELNAHPPHLLGWRRYRFGGRFLR